MSAYGGRHYLFTVQYASLMHLVEKRAGNEQSLYPIFLKL